MTEQQRQTDVRVHAAVEKSFQLVTVKGKEKTFLLAELAILPFCKRNLTGLACFAKHTHTHTTIPLSARTGIKQDCSHDKHSRTVTEYKLSTSRWHLKMLLRLQSEHETFHTSRISILTGRRYNTGLWLCNFSRGNIPPSPLTPTLFLGGGEGKQKGMLRALQCCIL